MKKLFVMLLAGFALGVADASAAVQLKLSLTDGSSRTYLLSDKPVITMPGDEMTVTVDEASFTCKRSEVAAMKFEESEAAAIESQAATGRFSYLNGIVECAGSRIDIYDLSGKLLMSGSDVLSTESLNQGIYIVKTNQHTVKISKK